MTLPVRISADWLARPQTQSVFAALERQGHAARAVGGAVRNALVGKAVHDVDIATTAHPDAIIAAATAAGLAPYPTGIEHGTVTVVSGGVPHEVTTLRSDLQTDGRHATVAFTDDWRADASRRDFTINALYCDRDGTLYDPLGGYPDLVARRVRFIGDPAARIREDYLRILRFFRFTAEYAEDAPDAASLAACDALRDGLGRLSAERVRVELLKTLLAPRAVAIVHEMHWHGYLSPILGAAPALEVLERLVHIERTTGQPLDPVRRLAALCVRLPEDALRLAERLRLSGAERDRMIDLASARADNGERNEADDRLALYRLGCRAYVDRELMAWALSSGPVDDPGRARRLAVAAAWVSPTFPIDGTDAIAAGMAPGRAIGEALRRLESEWIASGFRLDRANLLDRLKHLAAER